MKKVLFTLATLLAFGATVNAQQLPAPKLAFGYDANNLVTEVELSPGESVELKVVRVEQQELVVQGFAIQWQMLNSAGQPETTNVVCPKVYGGRTKTWTNPEGYSTPDEDLGGVIGNSLASQILEGYIYRWVGTNTSSNQFWWNSDADGNSPMPDVVGTFTVQTAENWDDDYATFEFDLAYGIYNQTADETPASQQGYEVRLDEAQAMSLKIINKNKQQTPVYADDPIITFAEDGSGVMITIENFTEYTITVDGEVFQQRNEDYAYVEKVYDKAQAIEVYAKNDPGAPILPAEKTETYNLPAKAKEVNSTPSVTHSYNPETGELNVWAYGCTEDDVEYTLYCDGVEYTGNMPIIVDTEAGYNHTWTATAVSPTTTVSAVSAPDEIVIDPVIPPTVTPDPVITVGEPNLEEGTVTITVEGEGTVTASVTNGTGTTNYTDEDGDGKIEIVLNCGEEADFAIVNATAVLPGDNVVPGHATSELIEIPAKTAKPVITSEEVEGGVNVTVTGNGTLNILIEGYGDGDVITYTGEGPKTFFLASLDDDQEVTVSANAQEEGKAVSDYAIEDIYIPEKQVTPDPTYTPVAPKVTIQTNTEDVVVEGIIEGAAADHGTVTLYTVDEEGVRHEVENPESFAREDEDYVVTVIAVATYENGEVMESEPVAVTITKKEQQPDPTSINEMNGGKTVASVRYFNMAGQEMQEANGMTIVVTTYTDGTSSAVKVMK